MFTIFVLGFSLNNYHFLTCRQGCGVGRFFRIPTPTPAILKNRLRLQQPSSKVWHRCHPKPPNCRLARAARVVCAQPGTVVCSQTPLSLVVCWSGGGGGGGGYSAIC